MRTFAIRINDDQIEDAFVYGTNVFCWTYDRVLRIYAVGDIERAAETLAPDGAAAINYALFHSRGTGASPGMSAAWSEAWSRGRDAVPPIVVESGVVPHVDVNVDVDAGDVLDILVFYGRLYFATDNGLFSVEPFVRETLPRRVRADSRVQVPCYSLSAGLGTVAASCGPGGLHLLLDDVRLTSDRRRARKLAPESLRAEIGFASVVNHRSRADFEFYSGTTVDTDHGRVLSKVRKAIPSRSLEVGPTIDDLASNVEFTLWDQSRLIVFQRGTIMSVSVIRNGDERTLNRARGIGKYRSGVDRFISASRVGRYLALESEKAVTFVGNDETSHIGTGPLVSCRSYPRSVRYRRLVTATGESGLWMIGVA
jgi:hypothetical protein